MPDDASMLQPFTAEHACNHAIWLHVGAGLRRCRRGHLQHVQLSTIFLWTTAYRGTISVTASASHAGSFTREVRALAVTVYFSSASALWLYDSIHLAIIMLQAGHSPRSHSPQYHSIAQHHRMSQLHDQLCCHNPSGCNTNPSTRPMQASVDVW